MDFGNVRLVGMTANELTEHVQVPHSRPIRATACGRVYMLPEDVILNTRRAFSVSTTSATGYSDLGVPEGRYIAPRQQRAIASSCKAGDCAPRTLLIRAPFFTRFDIGVTKRFPIAGAMNFELRADVLNVFDNINFNPVGQSRHGGDDLRGHRRVSAIRATRSIRAAGSDRWCSD